ncbi:MFS transporter [Peribacillus sp. NPDC097295]|uniref:MFS transporter n=1 Tax=Peribacillus sp. NPDC097295 TaxID=3364402 RepID=UPI0038129ED9
MKDGKQRSQWGQFAALVFGSFIAIEAMVFQAPAIPSISEHFQLPTYLAGLIILSFYIASTALYPVMGRVADQLGRKRVLLFGMSIFAISEFAAALSPSFSFFLGARVIQGFAVACILPVAIAYIGTIFPPEKRGMATGILSAVQAVASMTGAVIAGYLVQQYGWPIIYWISGALSIIGFVVVKVFVEEAKGNGTRSFDFLGVLLLIITTGCMLSVSTLVKSFGISSPYTLGTLGLGVVAAISLWVAENKMANPIVELSLLKRRLFAMVVIINLLVIAAFQAFIYSMNFFISTKPGGDVVEVGLFYMVIYGGSAVGGLIFGKLADKINNKKLVLSILLIPILTIFIFSFIDTQTPFSYISMFAFILGFSQGAITPIFIKYALSEIPPAQYGAGSGLFSTIRDFGAPFGSVTGILIFSTFTDFFTKSSLLSQAKQAGIDSNFMGAVEQARLSEGKVTDQGLVTELQSLGIKIEDLLSTASGEGLSFAIQNISYIVIGLFIITFILSLFIPGTKVEKVERIQKIELEIDNLDSKTSI